MRMRPIVPVLLWCALAAAASPPRVTSDELSSTAGSTAAGPQPQAGSSISVQVEKGLLSVSLKDADLFDVMDALAKESGVRIKVDKGARKKITLSFQGMPFEKGIRNLIRPLNYAMIWKNAPGAKDADEKVLVELDIFREGHQGAETVSFGPAGPGAEEGEPVESKVRTRVWSEETRQRMLQKLQVRPSEP